MIERVILATVFLTGIVSSVVRSSPAPAAQEGQFLMPEQSAAKAKQVLAQSIEALGGSSYLNMHDSTCAGRISQLDSLGYLEYVQVNEFRQFPDKERVEYVGKGRNTFLQALAGLDGLNYAKGGTVITLFNGNQGWSYDRSGVSELPANAVMEFQDQLQKNLDYILRQRIHEPGMEFRYAGEDVVDLMQADWVELVDGSDRTIRIAFSKVTHLPIRKVVETRDPTTRLKSEESEVFANFHAQDGFQTALQLTRGKNGAQQLQEFYGKCQYNTGLSNEFFSRVSLDERGTKEGKK